MNYTCSSPSPKVQRRIQRNEDEHNHDVDDKWDQCVPVSIKHICLLSLYRASVQVQTLLLVILLYYVRQQHVMYARKVPEKLLYC